MSARHRLLALLAITGDEPAAVTARALAETLDAAGRRLAHRDPQWRALVAVPRDADDVYAQIIDRGLANGVMLGGFELAIELSISADGAPDDLVAGFAACAGRWPEAIDVARSSVVVGTDLVIVDGTADVHLVYAMRRAPGTSHDQFSRFWADQHTKVAISTPGLAGYRQLHVDLGLSQAAAQHAGLPAAEIDGVALEWFASLGDFARAVGGPAEFRVRAKASEQQFNDLDGARAIVASVVASSDDSKGVR